MGSLLVSLVSHFLGFKPHRLLDGRKLLIGKERSAFAHGIGERLVGYEGVHKATAECFGRALKAFDGDVSSGLPTLELNDSGLVHSKALGHLTGSHAERFPQGTNPSTRRTSRLNAKGLNTGKTFIELFGCCDHTIRYIL
jgi:hypothetical protein